MRRRATALLGLSLVLVVSGCSTLQGRRVHPADDGAQSGCSKGISYYLSEPRFVIERRTGAAEKRAPQHDILVQGQPDPNRRFEVGLCPGWFSSDQFSLELSSDGRPLALNSSSTDETAQVIGGLVNLTVKAAEAAAGVAAKAAAGAEAAPAMASAAMVGPCSGVEETAIIEVFRLGFTCWKVVTQDDVDAACAVQSGSDDPVVLTEYLGGSKKIREALIDGRGESPGCELFHGLRQSVAELELLAPSGITASPQVVAAEKRVVEASLILKLLEEAEAKVRGATAPAPLLRTLTDLQDEVADRLALAVAGGAAEEAALEKSVRKLQRAVRLIVEADDAVGRRALLHRRDTLVAFLSAKVPTAGSTPRASLYKELGTQLSQVNAAIDGLLPAPTSEPDLLMATQVTSRIEERIFVDRREAPLVDTGDLSPATLEPDQLEFRVILAEARVKYGHASAVIIAAPVAAAPKTEEKAQ